MGRWLLGVGLGGLTMFAWGFLWWVVLPFESMVMKGASEESAVLAALGSELPETGVYFLPMPDEAAADQEAEWARVTELQKRGPIAQVFFRAEGVDAMSAGTMAMGLVHLTIVAALMAAFLRLFGQGLTTWGRRAGALAAAAVIAVVMIDLGFPIWFHHAWSYWLVTGTFDLTSLAFGGAVVAAFVKADEPASHATPAEPAAAARAA